MFSNTVQLVQGSSSFLVPLLSQGREGVLISSPTSALEDIKNLANKRATPKDLPNTFDEIASPLQKLSSKNLVRSPPPINTSF